MTKYVIGAVNDYVGICGYLTNRIVYIRIDKQLTLAEFKTWLTTNPVTILYEMETPIETDLTAEELAQYSALHTNYPNTTIYNDAGADMEVKYISIEG